ncbi:MAG: arsenate reductase ArsC [Chloroflexota bacterium]|nr:arsenate reductase ArsC [Chloroflexota bacterium]MEE2656659.1 arsenate reductase ArsC [Chloroflexota bacterium]
MKIILFVCVHNAGRSQMAAGFLNALNSTKLIAVSAGTMPSTQVNPVVVQAMREKGIDVSKTIPKIITQEIADKAHHIITMGCSIEETCPSTFLVAEDWGLDDPAGQPLDKVRVIRDQVELKVNELIDRES